MVEDFTYDATALIEISDILGKTNIYENEYTKKRDLI